MSRKITSAMLDFVDTSAEGWSLWADAGLGSDFYGCARAAVGPEKAASLALFQNYLDTQSSGERERLEGEAEYFYERARAFVGALSPHLIEARGESDDRKRLMRRRFRRAARETLRRSGGRREAVERYLALKAVVRLCSSAEEIIRVRDIYKEFMFRVYPQLHLRVA